MSETANDKGEDENYKETKDTFFNSYLEVTSGTEVPTIFRRWSLLGALGAWLGRTTYISHGDKEIYPNMYIMLLGVPGTRKSTAIKRAVKFMQAAGYESFAAQKTTKEKFLLDLSGLDEDVGLDRDGFLDIGSDGNDSECMIAADEFSDFFATNIIEFVSLLGVLWDYEGDYESKIKNGVSVSIPDPYISILSGNTQSTFAYTFPPEVVGQGFFSRLIAVYAAPTNKKITFPKKITDENKAKIVNYLFKIKGFHTGELPLSDGAMKLVDTIYTTWEPIEDDRFAYYGNRRLEHLFKLILVCAVSRLSAIAEEGDVLQANTILSYTEHFMPKAFGEFGKSRTASAAHRVLDVIESAGIPINYVEIWTRLSSELNSIDELVDILRGLKDAKKIQSIEDSFLPCKKALNIEYTDKIDFSYLTYPEIYGE